MSLAARWEISKQKKNSDGQTWCKGSKLPFWMSLDGLGNGSYVMVAISAGGDS